jgi:hypothetical protein
MPTPKQLLLHQTALAFDGRPDMSLLASLDNVTQEEASWPPDPQSPNIEQIVRHIAWAKSFYCHQAFATPMVLIDDQVNADGDSPTLPNEFPCGAAYGAHLAPGIEPAIELLKQSHRTLVDCLNAATDQSLDLPLATRHGQSGAHFFSIMLIHDLYHAGQIRTRRTLFAAIIQPLKVSTTA